MASALSASTMVQIERAFQTNKLDEYLAAIALCGRAIRENPFPVFINALLTRLADLFQGDKLKIDQSSNLIRLRIVKLLKECESDLSSAVSSEEIVRRIMKVSHSNDYKARSLAMLFLASAAPAVHANKKVHYLLAEGLNCENSAELMSTIIAAGSVGRLSSEFSSVIVEKIGVMLCQEEIDESVKLRLMDDLACFQEDVALTKYCMQLGRHLLRTYPGQNICVATINSLTALAKRNSLSLVDQITLILEEIGQIENNESFLVCCLTNLLDLAELMPHHWNSDQVMQLCNYRDKVSYYASYKPMILWLQCVNCLIKHTQVLLTDDFFNYLLPLLNVQNFTVKIHLVDVIYSRLTRVKSVERSEVLSNCLGDIMYELLKKTDCQIGLNDRVKFYKMISSYIQAGNSGFLDIETRVFAQFLVRMDNSYPERVFLKSLETLNLLCDIKPEISISVCSPALCNLQQNYGPLKPKQFSEASMLLYSLALRPIPVLSDKVNTLIGNVMKELVDSKKWCFAYKLARLGLRYGHFSNVALPVLEQIQGNCNTLEITSYIKALIHVAKSQLPKQFDVASLNAARQNLQYASLLLTPLVKNSRNSQNFIFAADYINCLYELYGAFNTILVTLNSNMGYAPSMNEISHMEYIRISFERAREEFHLVRQKWTALKQKSFDADDNTKQQLELFARYCQLFEAILIRVFATDIADLSHVPDNCVSCTNRPLEQLLKWGIESVNKSIHAVTGQMSDRVLVWKSNFASFSDIFRYLSEIPLYLPRAFFQQLHHTKIKLHVSPQPKENEQLTLSTKQLALSIEGVVETNNPKPIQNITVYVKVYMDKCQEPKLVDSRLCQVHDNYFNVNFLLKIAKSAEVVISLKFIDMLDKQTWLAGDYSRFHVIAPETRE